MVGFTSQDPDNSNIHQDPCLSARRADHSMLRVSFNTITYKTKELCRLGFNTESLKAGQSLGLLLTRERNLIWFLDGKMQGMVYVDGYPLDRPLWGVIDVYGKCKQVKAEVCKGSIAYPITFSISLYFYTKVPCCLAQELFGY